MIRFAVEGSPARCAGGCDGESLLLQAHALTGVRAAGRLVI
nr:hypothetical protein [uncultured Treponema sp.]